MRVEIGLCLSHARLLNTGRPSRGQDTRMGLQCKRDRLIECQAIGRRGRFSKKRALKKKERKKDCEESFIHTPPFSAHTLPHVQESVRFIIKVDEGSVNRPRPGRETLNFEN